MKTSTAKAIYAAIVLSVTSYAFIALRGPNGIPGYLEKRRLVHEYEETNQQLVREIEQKQQRIQRLKDNPADQEMEIRHKLKLTKPGEKVYILDSTK